MTAAQDLRTGDTTHCRTRTTVELKRRTFLATATGHANWRVAVGEGSVITGPVIVDVVITESTRDGVVCHPSYSVRIDGTHRYGGFADHLPTELGEWLEDGGSLIVHRELNLEAAQPEREAIPGPVTIDELVELERRLDRAIADPRATGLVELARARSAVRANIDRRRRSMTPAERVVCGYLRAGHPCEHDVCPAAVELVGKVTLLGPPPYAGTLTTTLEDDIVDRLLVDGYTVLRTWAVPR